MSKRWEHFEHDADIGVRGIGASKADAFEQAALALTAVAAPKGKAARFVDLSLLVAPEYPCTWPTFPAFQINHYQRIGPGKTGRC